MPQARQILLLALVLGTVAAFWPAAAKAQMCDTQREVIITLRKPHLGVPTVWDATYDQPERMVQFFSGVPLEGGTVLSVGRTLHIDSYDPEKIILVELNRRGRVLTEKSYPAKSGEVPVKMIGLGSGYLVLSDIYGGTRKDRRQIRLAWYGKAGNYRKQIVVEDPAYDLSGDGVLAAAEDDGFLVLAHAVSREKKSDQYGLLYRFTADGQQFWRRAYRPGIPNQLFHVTAMKDGSSYIATGRIRIDDGRMAGWVMKLGLDGAILWQRTYPRGSFSALKYGIGHPDDTGLRMKYLLYGDVMPSDGTPQAAWVMEVDELGEPLWQRYLRREDTAFSAAGLRREDDGRSIVVLNAKGAEGSGNRDYIRMLTLSPRGVIINDEAFIEGIDASAFDFIDGPNNERTVVATIVSDSKPVDMDMIGENFFVSDKDVEKTEEEEKAEPVQKGWVFLATAPEEYNDPCASRQRKPVK